MIVLALDLSTHCGFAHDGPGGRPIMHTKHLPGIAGNKTEGFEFGETYAALYRWLWELIQVVQPDRIAFEAPLMPRGQMINQESTVRLLFGLAAIVETIAGLLNIPCDERNVREVKRYWTGDGNAGKPAMMKQCRLLGWIPETDNDADAAALWALIKSECDPKFSLQQTPLFCGVRA